MHLSANDGRITAERPIWPWIAVLIIAPILVKAPLLLGLLIADPTLLYGGLLSHLHPGPLGGFPPFPTIDPNIAFTSHALGRRAVLDLFSGHMPWWNHYEGVGAPLAGEMQVAAFFPLTWLLIFQNGQLYMHIALQTIAGVSTWAVLRRLGCNRLAALACALSFEFNGTFAWLANAVINPIPLLPLTLLGVEMLRDRVAKKRGGGAVWLTIGIAASLYAGFPEVAYLDGLLILVWTLIRVASLPRELRVTFLRRVIVGGLAGLAIAAPVLIAFFDYLPLANTGGHDGGGFASAHLSPGYFLAVLSPYAFGGIFQAPAFAGFWGSVGGYSGCVLAALGIYGVFGSTLKGLRIALAIWIGASLALTYGIPGASVLVHIIPGLKLAAFYRYLPPSWEFSLCVLAALAMTDLGVAPHTARLRVAVALVLAACGLGLLLLGHAQLHPSGKFAHIAWAVSTVIIAGLIVLALPVVSSRFRIRGLAALLVFESVLCFIVPTLSSPSRGIVELGGVRFLRANLGMQRFVTLGPIQPNYGSYFGLASINHNDLPIPLDWTDYVARHLDNNAPPVLFTGVSRANPAGPTAAENLIANLDAYREIGTRYVLAPKNAFASHDFDALKRQLDQPSNAILKPVFSDEGMQIFELAAPASYFSARGCTLDPIDRDAVRATCTAPSTLTRLELYMSGWSARVNEQPATIERTAEIFQRIALPAGQSRIEYSFAPPYIGWAYLAFVIGWAIFVLDFVLCWKAVKRSPTPRPQ